MQQKNRYAAFDFFRVLMAIGIVLGHTWINFFSNQFIEVFGQVWIFYGIEQRCVSGFFIIGGIFLAKGVEKSRTGNWLEDFAAFQKKRIARLLEPVIFATVLYLLSYRFILHRISFGAFPGYWENFLLMGDINNIAGFNIVWYVSCLFWSSFALSAFLFKNKDFSLRVLFPILFFLFYAYSYNKFKAPNVHHHIMANGFLSAGLIRSAMELILGIEVYHAAEYFKKNYSVPDSFFAKTAFCCVEILCVLLLVFLNTSRTMERRDFSIYPCLAVLFFIFLIHREVLFLFCNRAEKLVGVMSKYTYMLYLTHCLWIQTVKYMNIFDFNKYVGNMTSILAVSVLISILFAVAAYHFNSWLIRAGNFCLEKLVLRRLLKK